MTDELSWQTVDSETDYTCPGFHVREDHVWFPDGEAGEFHAVVEGDSVVILPFTPAGDVVVIEEWRQPVGRVNRGFPAGGQEPDDDDLASTAHRELTEETGYVADEVEKLLTIEPMNGLVDAAFHYYVATDSRPTGEQQLDANESIRVERTTWDRLRQRVRAGDVRDGRTALGVLYYDLVREDS